MNAYARLVYNWAYQTFGEVAANPVERSARIVEEAVEVAQADGVDPAMLHAIIDRTYSRPADTVEKELGGLLVTVYARCGLQFLDPDKLLANEIERVTTKPASHWRGKHDAKVTAGTVTGPVDMESSLPVCQCGNYRRLEYTRMTCAGCGGKRP